MAVKITLSGTYYSKKLQRVLSTIAQAFYRNNNISLMAAVDDTLEISIEMP
jgi:hypothetical protein